MNKGRLGSHLEEVILDLGFSPDDVVTWRTGEEGFTLYGHRNLIGYEFVHTVFQDGETDYEDRRITQVVWPVEVLAWAEEAVKEDRKVFWADVEKRLAEFCPESRNEPDDNWLDKV